MRRHITIRIVLDIPDDLADAVRLSTGKPPEAEADPAASFGWNPPKQIHVIEEQDFSERLERSPQLRSATPPVYRPLHDPASVEPANPDAPAVPPTGPVPSVAVGVTEEQISTMTRQFAHAEKHIPELTEYLRRQLSRHDLSWDTIRRRLVTRANEIAQEDPPAPDNAPTV